MAKTKPPKKPMSNSIPDHLIPVILQRLPVKALLRFRCLSQSIRHGIDSAAFVKAHLRRSLQTKTHRQLLFHDRRNRSICAIDLDDDDHGRDRKASKLINTIKFKDYAIPGIQFRGSCNGLLLLSSHRKRYKEPFFWIWNPFTRSSKKLPDCPSLIPHCHTEIFTGFGYDPIENDYNVVQIRGCHSPDFKVQGWVFSVTRNIWCWMFLDCPVSERHMNEIHADAVFTDGALHWLSDVSENHWKNIVTFDLSENAFVNVIPAIPPSCHGEPERVKPCSLLVLGGRLVLYEEFAEHAELSFAVKNGERFAWEKLEHKININLLRSDEKDEGFHGVQDDFKLMELSKDGKKVLFHTCLIGAFFWYDLKHGSLERVDTPPVIPKNYSYHNSSPCWESLVSTDARCDQSINEFIDLIK